MEDMWSNFDGTFEISESPADIHARAREKFNRQAQEYGLWGGLETVPDLEMEQIEHLWDEEKQEDLLSDLLESIGLDDDEESMLDAESAKWSPYPSKIMFLLDAIDNLPRLRVSGSFMKVLLWLLRELGIKHVPSFDALRKKQKLLREETGVPTIHWMSPKGNTYSFNDPRALVSNDWLNPLTCPHICRYPVIPRNGIISEIWHARKWHKDLDRKCLSPMYDAGQERHYFLDEPASLSDGQMVIPVQWLEDEQRDIWVEVWNVETDTRTNLTTIKDQEVTLMRADELKKNMLDLEGDGLIPHWSEETVNKGYPLHMPNPDRKLAEGDPLYSSFIDIFGDDVSGNRSKSWNKHWNIYTNHRNLPRKLLHQQYHTHFVSTSPYATVPEQFHGVKRVIEETHKNPIKTRHAITGRQTRLKLFCNCGPSDNPAQSENSGHIGGKGNFPCRKCHVGGSQKDKETDQGFHAMFSAGLPRSSSETLQLVEEQIRAACLGVAKTVKDMQTDTGVKDAFTQHWIDELIEHARNLQKLQLERPITEIQTELLAWVEQNKSLIFNPFLSLEGFDASADTPVEILHTILLGIVKYVWHGSHMSWNAEQKKTYSVRLQQTDTLSLSILPIHSNYIMHFHVYDLVDKLNFELTKAIGELSALLWFPEIQNLDEYLDDVETAAANVLDIAAEIDSSKIIAKLKYHLLAHLREDIIRFGPLVGVATEIFESYNSIFRFCSILSNHMAPSRDIAYQLAEQETVKHLLSGGWWMSKDGNWKEPGPGVRNYVTTNPILRKLCGWSSADSTICAGTIRLEPIKRDVDKKRHARKTLTWHETQGEKAVNIPSIVKEPGMVWYQGKMIIAQSQDECKVRSWIFASSPFNKVTEPPVTGRILEILQDSTAKVSYVILDTFSVAATRHELFGRPKLMRRFEEPTILVIKGEDILFNYNVQHDCQHAGCTASGTRIVMQERKESGQTEKYVEHKAVDHYLVNTHAFHNAHLIRTALPRNLTRPLHYAQDRQKHYNELATLFRETQDSKRVANAQKAAERKKKSEAEKGEKRRRVEDLIDAGDVIDDDAEGMTMAVDV